MTQSATLESLQRQAIHWTLASKRLSDLENMAATQAWHGLDFNVASLLKKSFKDKLTEVEGLGRNLNELINKGIEHRQGHQLLLQLRNKYIKTEETIHYYTLAINTRTTPGLSAMLRACDVLCKKSMDDILKPLGKEVPPVFTFIDKGIGASILKAGLRLWDGKVSPVAAIKITQHNLLRPTAIIHETGHQVAHILKWTEETKDALQNELTTHPEEVRKAYANWTSEIVADVFAFVHTGFAAVAALHDVVSGNTDSVFTYHRNDPHPISYIRVLLNIEMCNLSFGSGPWNKLEEAFKQNYDIKKMISSDALMIRQCEAALKDVAKLLLKRSFVCFGNKAIHQIVNPEHVSPRELENLEKRAGAALYTSHSWLSQECLRILALNGYKIGTKLGHLPDLYKQQEEWMTRLGYTIEMN